MRCAGGRYVEFPDDPLAVPERRRGAYMYGSAVLVQPVVQPVAADTNLTAHYLHFPHLPMPARRARLPASRRQQAGSKQAARQRAAGRQQRAGS